MIHEVINNILDFHPCCIFEDPINLSKIKSLDFISINFGILMVYIFCTEHKPILELHINILGDLFVGVFFNDEALGQTSKQMLVNKCT